MEWFNVSWIFGIITLACAGFFLQMVMAYNSQRGQIMPALKQVRDIKKRHEMELEKVDRLATESEAQLATLTEEANALEQNIKTLDERLDVYKKADSDDR